MRLGLGTAQFGSDYGVTNAVGKVPPTEVARMLQLAAGRGIKVIDTAAAYGESESALGRALGPDHPFLLVTKCQPVTAQRIGAAEALQVRDAFLRSLERLGQSSVHGLLVHQPADLRKPGAELLVEQLIALKRQGLVHRLGASLYGAKEIPAITGLLKLDIAQVPVSIADQRLVADGTLRRLRAEGVEIHARSVFLQGLLLADELPPALVGRGRPLQRIAAHARDAGVSRLALALGFVGAVPEIDVGLVGATSCAELEEILRALDDSPATGDLSHLAVHDEELLNPSRWPKTAAPSRV
jgi:aryl-alcohol dehydrogenase-like predicted oxidoreductase